jgi:hypothetical protein
VRARSLGRGCVASLNVLSHPDRPTPADRVTNIA